MAQLNFPDNPINGQLYPNPCPEGVTQYRWDTGTGMWRIVGVATGVVPGTYGDRYNVAQVTVDVQGAVTEARDVPIAQASLFETGIVQLTDQLDSVSDNFALTASGGRRLQLQIGDLNACRVVPHNNVVEALNSLQDQTTQLNEGALIWCGYYNAEEGDVSFVSITGQRLGYQIGQELPPPGSGNGGDFFIVTKAGNPYIAGDYNAPNQFIEAGNWIVSEKVRWSEVDARGIIQAKDVAFSPIAPLTSTDVQGAIYQITQLLRTGVGGATISGTKPSNPYPGQLWWDSDDGVFYVYYVDTNSAQWVEAGGGNTGNLGAGAGGIYLLNTGVGLSGGPITTSGTISLEPAFQDAFDESLSHIGGVLPRRGFDYSNTTGILDLDITSDYTGKDPNSAFSQEGANLLNAKIDSLSGSNVLAATYNAALGEVVYATPAGAAKGFIAGQNLPPPSASIDNYYVIVTVGGNVGPDGPQESQAGDWYICEGQESPAIWFLIDYDTPGQTATSVAVTPIPGIEQASNVQRAIELVELQVQDRIEFVETTSDGINVKVTNPDLDTYDGTTLSIGVDYASVNDRGIVQLTNDVTGTSETLAVTQKAIAALNGKVDALTGANVLAGTYNSNTGLVESVTPAGAAAGFQVALQAPPADRVPDNYYLIVIVSGGYGPPGAVLPPGGVQSGDWFIAERAEGTGAWITIDFENRVISAIQVSIDPIPDISAINVQGALSEMQEEIDDCFTQMQSANDGISIQTYPVNGLFGYVARFTLNPATDSDIGGVFVAPNFGLGLTPSGGLSLTPATGSQLGGIKVGQNLSITPDGTLNAAAAPVGATKLLALKNISSQFNGTRTTFTLETSTGEPFPETTTADMLFIEIGGINQPPTTAYLFDYSSSQITFTSAPPTGTSFSGRVVMYIAPPEGAIAGVSQLLAGNNVTLSPSSGVGAVKIDVNLPSDALKSSGISTGVTDSNGKVTVRHNLGVVFPQIQLTAYGDSPALVQVSSVDTQTVTVVCFNPDGTPKAGESVPFYYFFSEG